MTSEELEKKIQQLNDREGIKQLHYTYCNALTFADWDAVVDCFAEDCVTDLGPQGVVAGKANIDRMFREGISVSHGRGEGTIVVHPIITFEGDKVKGNWLVFFLRAGGTGWGVGEYNEEYVKENGKWKFGFMKWRSHGMSYYIMNLERLGRQMRGHWTQPWTGWES